MSSETMTIVWIAFIGVAMYFFMFRPQSKQRKARAAMMNSLKKGDRVVTIGGIHGIIRNIKDERVTLEIASEVYVHFTKAAISSILRSDGKSSPAQDTEAAPAEAADEDADYVIEPDEEQE